MPHTGHCLVTISAFLLILTPPLVEPPRDCDCSVAASPPATLTKVVSIPCLDSDQNATSESVWNEVDPPLNLEYEARNGRLSCRFQWLAHGPPLGRGASRRRASLLSMSWPWPSTEAFTFVDFSAVLPIEPISPIQFIDGLVLRSSSHRRYQDLSEENEDGIGKGKYGSVSLAVDRYTSYLVAIKRIFHSGRSKLRREVATMLWLDGGPNLLPLLDVIWIRGHSHERDTVAGLVLPYVEDDFDRCSLRPTETVDLAFQLLQALNHTHSRGIIHKDIKGANVLVGPRPERHLLLIDFGQSDAVGRQAQSLRVGSRPYKAPELVFGLGDYDYGIDVWAAGVLVTEWLFHLEYLFDFGTMCRLAESQVRWLGSGAVYDFMVKYALSFEPELWGCVGEHEESRLGIEDLPQLFIERVEPFRSHEEDFNEAEERAAAILLLDLLSKMLVCDPAERITAHDALLHEVFQSPRTSKPHEGD